MAGYLADNCDDDSHLRVTASALYAESCMAAKVSPSLSSMAAALNLHALNGNPCTGDVAPSVALPASVFASFGVASHHSSISLEKFQTEALGPSPVLADYYSHLAEPCDLTCAATPTPTTAAPATTAAPTTTTTCVDPDGMVSMADGSLKRVRDLSVGDQLLDVNDDGTPTSSTYYMQSHQLLDEPTPMVEIEFEARPSDCTAALAAAVDDSKATRTMRLTHTHNVYVNDSRTLVYPHLLTPFDHMITTHVGAVAGSVVQCRSRVVSVRDVLHAAGFSNPLVTSSRLFINGALTSTFPAKMGDAMQWVNRPIAAAVLAVHKVNQAWAWMWSAPSTMLVDLWTLDAQTGFAPLVKAIIHALVRLSDDGTPFVTTPNGQSLFADEFLQYLFYPGTLAVANNTAVATSAASFETPALAQATLAGSA